MGRVATIEYCGDCPHRYYEGNDLHCDKTGAQVAENMEIPDFCPLPIASQYPIKAELVEALGKLTERAKYFGYGFALGHEMADAEIALSKAKGE